MMDNNSRFFFTCCLCKLCMKISKFNVINTCNNSTFIYNTLTTGFVKMETKQWFSIYENIKKKGNVIEDKVCAILQNAGILVDDDYNELNVYKYKCYSSMFQNSSLILSIAPTMKCNFNCFYCFEDGKKNIGLMSDDIESRLIKFISLHRQQEIHITWFGGEPLLGFDRIYSICKHLRQLKIKFASDMITNGSLLNESIIQKLDILNLKYIHISLDGIAETHDKRRIFNNGAPSFNLIIENIRKLVSLTDIPLSIKVTMDHTNPTSLSDITNYFNNNFSEYLRKGQIAISHNYVRDRTDFDKSGNCFTHEDLLKQDQDALRNKEKALVYPELPNLAMPCMFRCKNSLAIDSKGHIYKCLEHLGLPNNKVGDLAKGTLSLEKLSETMFGHNPFDSDECINCNVFPICGGGCPIDRNKNWGKNKKYCSMYKRNLSEILPDFYMYKYSSR